MYHISPISHYGKISEKPYGSIEYLSNGIVQLHNLKIKHEICDRY